VPLARMSITLKARAVSKLFLRIGNSPFRECGASVAPCPDCRGLETLVGVDSSTAVIPSIIA
jgi:hypothetical protein